MFADSLRRPVEEVPGALACVLMGFDGIVVEDAVAPEARGRRADLLAMATEYAALLGRLRTVAAAASEGGGAVGGLEEVTLGFSDLKAVARILSEHYFLVLFLERDGNAGKGRYLLRLTAPAILPEL